MLQWFTDGASGRSLPPSFGSPPFHFSPAFCFYSLLSFFFTLFLFFAFISPPTPLSFFFRSSLFSLFLPVVLLFIRLFFVPSLFVFGMSSLSGTVSHFRYA